MRKPVIAVLLLLMAAASACALEEGYASWYGGKFHGRLTSSGEVFDTNEMTAAHKTLPFGTMVRVTNQDNGRSTVVKINDRGPFVEGRVIDLSRAAAIELAMIDQGVARVAIEIVDFITDKSLFAIQVGAYGLERNAQSSGAVLEAAGFVMTLEKTTLGITRVLVRGIEEKNLPETRKKIEGLGFSRLLVKKEKTESRQASQPSGDGAASRF